jgi:hypothetical protein
MSLDTAISLTTVENVLDYIGSNVEQNAFWIYCSQGDATAATVQVSLDNLILIITGGVQAGTVTIDLTLAANDTIGELVAVINALTGWEAGRICHSSSDSANLLETGQLDCLGAINQQTLIITGDYLIEQLINRASDYINRYCNIHFKEATHTLERYNGDSHKLFLNNYPVNNIIQLCQGTTDVIRVRCTDNTAYNAYVEVDQDAQTVRLLRDGTVDATFDISNVLYDTLSELATAINAVANWEATIASSAFNSYPSAQLFNKLNVYCKNIFNYLRIPEEPIDEFSVDYEAGIIHLSSSFLQGFQNVYVSYTAGYAAGSIPPALEQICIELVKFKYSMISVDPTLKSEKIGRVYAYTRGDMEKALSTSTFKDLELFQSRLL